MRHLMFLAMAAIAVLSSCTKTEIIQTGKQQEIGFKMVESVMTKATTEHTGDLGVFAYYNEASSHTPYFQNVQFSSSGETGSKVWKGGYYWPLSGTLDFVVYAPYDANFSYATNTYKLTTTTNVEAATDFLYGAEYYDNSDDKGYSKTATAVPVVLKHGKAKITVTVKTSTEASGDVKISGFNFTPFNTVGKPTVTYSATGALDSTNPITWTDAATPLTFTTPTDALTSSATNICNGVLVIPANDTRTLSFNYQFKIGETENWTTALSYSDAITTDIEAGKSYTFAITISPTEITIDADVDEWGDASNVPVSVPTA